MRGIALLACLALASVAAAQGETTAFRVLEMPTSVRSLGLGGAAFCLERDFPEFERSPGLLGNAPDLAFAFNQSFWLFGSLESYAGIILPAGKSAFALSVTYLRPPEARRYDIWEPGSPIALDAFAGSVGYGIGVAGVGMGIAVRYAQRIVDDETYNAVVGTIGAAYGVDLPPLLGTRAGGFRVSLSLQNIGRSFQSEELPSVGLISLGYSPWGSITGVLAAGYSFAGEVELRGGIELQPTRFLALRGGVAARGSVLFPSGGAAIRLPFGANRLLFHYSLGYHVPTGDLVHGVSIEFRRLPKGALTSQALVNYHYAKGMMFYLDGKFEEAIAEWEKVLKLDPKHRLAAGRLEQARRRVTRVERATHPKPRETK